MRDLVLRFALAALVACGGAQTSESAPAPVTVASAESEPAPVASNSSAPAAFDPGPIPDVQVPEQIERVRVPVGQRPTIGSPEAMVTIIEFTDFECPFCSRAQPTLERVREHYGSRVRIVFRNLPLPFHRHARDAAALAAEAYRQGGDARFWPVHDLIFANQRQLERSDLERYAVQAQLDITEVRAALDGGRHEAWIGEDEQLASRLGVRGTPNFFINGRHLAGAQPFEAFQEIIDQELVVAFGAIQSGVSPVDVYAHLTADGLEAIGPPTPRAPTPAAPHRERDPAAVYRVPLDGQLPQRGRDDALVTIVEVADYQCPFCSRVQPTLEQVLQEFGRDVRLVWMNNPLPFHHNALPAAKASLEAFRQQGNRAFWQMHEKLFENQQALSRADLERYATEVGLDMDEFRAALDTDRHEDVIRRQQQLVTDLDARGTPTFFINGRNLRGAQPIDRFRDLIREERDKARQMVRRGTARRRLYETIMANAATSPQFLAPGAAPPAPSSNRPDPDRVYNIDVPRHAPTKGPRRAPVVIHEFADFQCPFCARARPTIDQLLAAYGDRIRLVWRDFPLQFHAQAKLASAAGREVRRQAGDEKFWEFHNRVFADQRRLAESRDAAIDFLVEQAQQVGGVNHRRLRRALSQSTHESAIDREMEEVRQNIGSLGTPTFFINGRMLQGAQPYANFEAAVVRALREANASTTPRNQPAATPSQPGSPSGTVSPTSQVRLAPGFVPDPHIVRGSIIGTQLATQWDASCAGYVAAQPTVTLEAQGAFPNLRVLASSQEDTTLVIRRPDGSYWCNDDSEGLDPMVEQPFPVGVYQIFVGTYEANQAAQFVLGITELATMRPSTLP